MGRRVRGTEESGAERGEGDGVRCEVVRGEGIRMWGGEGRVRWWEVREDEWCEVREERRGVITSILHL